MSAGFEYVDEHEDGLFVRGKTQYISSDMA